MINRKLLKSFSSLFEALIVGIIYLFSSEKLSLINNRISDNLYTKSIAKKFRSCGINLKIKKPIDLVGPEFITVKDNVTICKNTLLNAWAKYKDQRFEPSVEIGNNVHIGEGCHITSINKIIIKDNVLFGKYITVSDNSHGLIELQSFSLPPKERPLFSKGPVVINDGVWIGDKATILAGVTIGKNAIIGANSLVNKDIPENCVVGGNPARIIKQL